MHEEILIVTKDIIKDVALYFVPIAALGISIISLHKSRRVTKLENKLKEYDLRLKEYEIEKIESERQEKQKEIELKNKADVRARIYKISDGKYKIKVYNCGQGVAYNVDYEIPDEYQIVYMKEVTPFEILNPGCNFEEHVVIHMQSSKKYKVIIKWNDVNGKECGNEVLESW
ncbi:MAG: hypothetical protein K2M73_01910 [Lachnospiraceae bacterium]|nr:hypothetical protein [Lachnospiraceae bacterium]